MPPSEATESETAKPNSGTSPIHPCDIPIQSLEDEDTMDNTVKNPAFYNIFGEPVDSNMYCNTFYEPFLSDQHYNSENLDNAIGWNLSGESPNSNEDSKMLTLTAENMPLDIESAIDPGVREAFAKLKEQGSLSIHYRCKTPSEISSDITPSCEQFNSFDCLQVLISISANMSRDLTPESKSAETTAEESEAWTRIADNWKNTFGNVPAAVKEMQILARSVQNTKKRPLEDEESTPSAANKKLKRFEAMMPSASASMLQNSPPPSEDGQTLLSQSTTAPDKRLKVLGKTMPLAHNVMGHALTPPASDDGHKPGHSTDSEDLSLTETSLMYSRKFEMPYQPGWQFEVHAHIPPKPTPVIDECLRMDNEEKVERDKLSFQQRFQKHPPLQGSSMGNNPLNLQIQKPIRMGRGFQAQVFTVTPSLCELSWNKDGSRPQSASPIQLVAKVFDPLYQEDPEKLEDSSSYTPETGSYLMEINPFKSMDQFYTHETRAYQKLGEFQGRGIPHYYGSYSLSLPLPSNACENATREVRLILVQQIEGTPMSKLDPEGISQQARQRILRSIIELECKIYKRDIELTDLAPRNVMLVGDVENNPEVVFIDFGDVLFGRFQDDDPLEGHEKYLGRYMSPLIHWWKEICDFRDWVDWDWYPWIVQEFDHTKNTITPKMWEDFSVARSKYEKCTGTKVLGS